MRSFVFVLLAITVAAGAREPNAPIASKTRDQLFAWFDLLPLPDTRGCKYVTVRTGGYLENRTDGRRYLTAEGFLLSDDGASFSVVLRDWTTARFEKSGTGPDDEEYVGYRESSLEQKIKTLLPKLGTQNEADQYGFDDYDDRLGRTAQLLALARILARDGRSTLSDSLLRKLPAWRQVSGGTSQYDSFEIELQDQFASLFCWQILRAFDDEGITRPQLLERFQRVEVLCPKADYELKRIRHYASVLKRMLDEDHSHPSLPPEALAALPPAERANELVFALRDERLHWERDFDADWPHPDPSPRRPQNGAFAGLKSIGFDAVPALIEALTDDRLTREVNVSRRMGGSIHVESVSRLAWMALNEIAGLNFAWEIPNYGMMSPDQREASLHRQIKEWWKAVQEQGELAWLSERLATKENPEYAAKTLLERYPDAAEDLLIDALRRNLSPLPRRELLKLLLSQDTPKRRQVWLDELSAGPTLGNRLEAAWVLRRVGDARANAAMLAEWAKVKAAGPITCTPGRPMGPPDLTAVQPLVQFLASSSSADSIRALTDGLTQHADATRAAILQWLGRRGDVSATDCETATAESEAAIELTLLANLSDRAELSDDEAMAYDWCLDPRICDIAACYLASHWPEKYPFDPMASPASRDAAIAHMRPPGDHTHDLPKPERPVPIAPTPGKANTITAIEWPPATPQVPETFRTRMQRLAGCPCTADSMVTILTRFSTKPERGASGIEITVFRYSDFSGIRLRVKVTPGRAPRANDDCTQWFTMKTPSNLDYESSGNRPSRSLQNASAWTKFERTLHQALSSPPDEPFRVSAGFYGGVK